MEKIKPLDFVESQPAWTLYKLGNLEYQISAVAKHLQLVTEAINQLIVATSDESINIDSSLIDVQAFLVRLERDLDSLSKDASATPANYKEFWDEISALRACQARQAKQIDVIFEALLSVTPVPIHDEEG